MLPKLWHHLFRTSYDLPSRPANTPAPSPVHRDVERLSLSEDLDPDHNEATIVAEKTGSPKANRHFTEKIKRDKERFRPGLYIEIPHR